VGGWSVAPILTVQNGTPYTVVNGVDRDLDGSTLGDRPNIGNPRAPVTTRAIVVANSVCGTGLQNPALVVPSVSNGCVTANDVHFVQVTSYQPTSPLIVSRNANYTGRYLSLDSNILKKFAITERVAFELRGEFFNITNTQSFDTPPSSGSGNRNVTTSTGTNFLNFSILNGGSTPTGQFANGSRTMRVGGKIIF
jgi:hypothetical protein